jgi:hypothetical protein
MLSSSKVKGIVSLTAAVVMYFTPDHIDRIIEGLLGGFGITSLLVGDKKK